MMPRRKLINSRQIALLLFLGAMAFAVVAGLATIGAVGR